MYSLPCVTSHSEMLAYSVYINTLYFTFLFSCLQLLFLCITQVDMFRLISGAIL